MFKTKVFQLGSAFGIPLYVDISFLFIAVLVLMCGMGFLFGVLITVGFGFSILAHEFGHCLVARKYRCRTRKITLSMLGGCAELESIPKVPKQEMLVALAGPGTSLALAVVFSVVAFLFCRVAFLFQSFTVLSGLNAGLGFFNLLPGFPMDGGRILRAWLSRKKPRQDATRTAMNVGRVFAALFACWGVFNIMSGNIGGLISLLISWFIWQAGWQEYMASVYGG